MDIPEKLSSQMDDMMKVAVLCAETYFEERGSLAPMFVLISANGNYMPVCTPFEDDRDKELVMMALRQAIYKMNIVRYIGMGEAWCRTIAPEDYDTLHGRPVDGIPASQAIDRTEIIWLLDVKKSAKAVAYQIPITRDSEGRPTLGEINSWGDGAMGTFASLFDTPPEMEAGVH